MWGTIRDTLDGCGLAWKDCGLTYQVFCRYGGISRRFQLWQLISRLRFDDRTAWFPTSPHFSIRLEDDLSTRISLQKKEITASLSEIFSHSLLPTTKKPVSYMEIFCFQKRCSVPSSQCLSYKLRVSVGWIIYMIGRQICTSQQSLSKIMLYSLQTVQHWIL